MATMYKQNFRCNKNFDHYKNIYIWDNEEPKTYPCEEEDCCGILEIYIPEETEKFFSTTIIGKHKTRDPKEGRQRSLKNFKKEIYDTLPASDQRHFAKKYGWKHRGKKK